MGNFDSNFAQGNLIRIRGSKLSVFSQKLVKFPQLNDRGGANYSTNFQWRRGTNVAELPMVPKRRFYDKFQYQSGTNSDHSRIAGDVSATRRRCSVAQHIPQIAELDCKPFVVNEQGGQILDARVRVTKSNLSRWSACAGQRVRFYFP
jgi:hypothetical protein